MIEPLVKATRTCATCGGHAASPSRLLTHRGSRVASHALASTSEIETAQGWLRHTPSDPQVPGRTSDNCATSAFSTSAARTVQSEGTAAARATGVLAPPPATTPPTPPTPKSAADRVHHEGTLREARYAARNGVVIAASITPAQVKSRLRPARVARSRTAGRAMRRVSASATREGMRPRRVRAQAWSG